MVEFTRVEYRNPGMAPFMFGMTILACLFFFQAAMVAALLLEILGHLLVAITAKPYLRALVELFMAFGAFAFELGMTLNHRPRHQ